MNAPYANFAAAQSNYDRAEPPVLADDYEWIAPKPRFPPTDCEIEQFIANVAAEGVYRDGLGMLKLVDGIYQAIAQQWVTDRAKLGETIGPKFWRWAKQRANNT